MILAPHQAEAVGRLRELLASCGGALLADDVGLGKSLVAAEIAREYEHVELIVPSALVEQWRAFGLDARILTHDALVNDPFVPQPRERLVIVDEAHAFRNPATQRYDALARRTIAARVLLVTATPVCNALDDLEALLGFIARDDLLADRGVPSIDVAFATRDVEAIRTIVGALVIRRNRSVLPPELDFGELDRRVIRHPLPEVAIDSLRFPLVGEHAILRRFLWRRLESSEAALLETLKRQVRFYRRALESGRALSKREYRRAFGGEEDADVFQQILFWDLFVPAGELDGAAVRDELARIDVVRAQVERSPQTKRKLLLQLLDGDPTLIFTGSAATARDLHAHIPRSGLVTSRERSRDAVLRAFKEGRIDVVVSTDMSAEGLNLQRAGVVVHYDIPWNPVKLDQRNGRAYRIGQTRPSVRAVYFLPESRETRIAATIAAKNRTRRRALQAIDPPPSRTPTLRPRIARDAAVVRFLQEHGTVLGEAFGRRHRAGIERLLAQMAREVLDQRRLADLAALVEYEWRMTSSAGLPLTS